MKRRLRIILSCFLIAASVFSFSIPVCAKEKEEIEQALSSMPENWPEAPSVSATSAILMDASSGGILYGKNATKASYPASTTKLMTALLALEKGDYDGNVPFSSRAVSIPAGSSHIGMRRNETMSFRECLYGLLLPSANEVANALGEYTSGSLSEFVTAMNEKAKELGCVHTSFQNANGLHDSDHFTCAYDLALILKECLKYNLFMSISSELSYVHHKDRLLNKDIPMTNTNQMIRPTSPYYYEYAICGKTGHTEESGYNLTMYAEKDGMKLIAVVMGCEDGEQYVSTKALFEYGFNYFKKVLPMELDPSLQIGNEFTSTVLAVPVPKNPLLRSGSDDTILIPKNADFAELTRMIQKTDSGIAIVYCDEDYPLATVYLSYSEGAGDDFIITGDKRSQEPQNLVVFDWGLLIAFLILSGLLYYSYRFI